MEGTLRQVIEYWMEGEIESFIKVWISACLSLCYCFFAGKILPKGLPRFAAFIPVVFLFLRLPLLLHTVHLGGTTAFFLAWLANFKLLLFSFDKGPLSNLSHLSLPRFVAVACLPIKLQSQNPPPKSPENGVSGAGNSLSNKTLTNYTVKMIFFSLIVKSYDFEHLIHPTIIIILYSFHIYLCLEMILAIAAAVARTFLGAELEPQFNEPYLSTSLQDFWGRRWNLMVTRILRPTVYIPVLEISAKIFGRRWAALPAVMATFVVSALMHELIFYYWFFLLHGACLIVEIVVKKRLTGRCRLPKVVGTILTVGFVLVTAFWLFFPQFLRCKADERGLAEIAAVGMFFKDVGRAFKLTVDAKAFY